MFVPEDIDSEPVPGLRGRHLYRRVQLDGLHYEGVVRYPRELENQTDDVRLRITEFLNRRSSRLGWDAVAAELYNPLDMPMLNSPVGAPEGAGPPTDIGGLTPASTSGGHARSGEDLSSASGRRPRSSSA